jgi:hypothetical protein
LSKPQAVREQKRLGNTALDDPGFEYRQSQRIFLISEKSILALEPTQLLNNREKEAVLLAVR